MKSFKIIAVALVSTFVSAATLFRVTNFDDIPNDILSKHILSSFDDKTKMTVSGVSNQLRTLTRHDNTIFMNEMKDNITLSCGPEKYLKITSNGYGILRRSSFKNLDCNDIVLQTKCFKGMAAYVQNIERHNIRKLKIIIADSETETNDISIATHYYDALENLFKFVSDFDTILVEGEFSWDYTPSSTAEARIFSLLSDIEIKSLTINVKLQNIDSFESFCKKSSLRNIYLPNSFSTDVNMYKKIQNLRNLEQFESHWTPFSIAEFVQKTLPQIKSIVAKSEVVNFLIMQENKIDCFVIDLGLLNLNSLFATKKEIKSLGFSAQRVDLYEIMDVLSHLNSLQKLSIQVDYLKFNVCFTNSKNT